MNQFFEFLIAVPIMVVCYQLYSYSVNKKGVERQSSCQTLGILYMTVGIVALIARKPAFVFMGLMLIMVGFRLMAKGLDRIDKTVFIDRYSEEEITKKEID